MLTLRLEIMSLFKPSWHLPLVRVYECVSGTSSCVSYSRNTHIFFKSKMPLGQTRVLVCPTFVLKRTKKRWSRKRGRPSYVLKCRRRILLPYNHHVESYEKTGAQTYSVVWKSTKNATCLTGCFADWRAIKITVRRLYVEFSTQRCWEFESTHICSHTTTSSVTQRVDRGVHKSKAPTLC